MNVFLSLIAVLIVAVLPFQNCAKRSFSQSTAGYKALSVDETSQLVIDDLPVEIITDLPSFDDAGLDDPSDSSATSSLEPKKEEPKAPTPPVPPTGTTMHHEHDDDDSEDHHDMVKHHDEIAKHHDGDEKDDDRDDGHHDSKKSGKSCVHKDDGNARFVCIVEGSGKSSHVALSDAKLESEHKTPRSVCMSENACKNIIGKTMEVKSVESRGFCKHDSAHTVRLTDDDVKHLVSK